MIDAKDTKNQIFMYSLNTRSGITDHDLFGRFDQLGTWAPYLPHQKQTYVLLLNCAIWIVDTRMLNLVSLQVLLIWTKHLSQTEVSALI